MIRLGTQWLKHGLRPPENIRTLISLPLSTLTTDNQYFKRCVSLTTTTDEVQSDNTVMQLGLTSAPVVYVYPPTEGARAPANGKTSPSKYDFSGYGSVFWLH